jgi:hypothetical protein
VFPESPVGALGLGWAAAGVVAAAGLAAALDAAGAVFMPLDADAIAAGVADTGSVVPEVACVAVLVIAEVVVTAPSLLAAASTEFVALPPAWVGRGVAVRSRVSPWSGLAASDPESGKPRAWDVCISDRRYAHVPGHLECRRATNCR